MESENRGKLWMNTQQSSQMDSNEHDSAMSQSTVTVVAEASYPENQRSKNKSDNGMRFLERSFSAAGAAVLSAILVNPLDVAKVCVHVVLVSKCGKLELTKLFLLFSPLIDFCRCPFC